MIEVNGLCKSYGAMLAVDTVSFTVRPGAVTAFVGPNGAGKSTVLRIALGLDSADSGSVLFQGRPYRQLDAPSRRVGALLDAGAIHPGQTGRMHLRVLARAAGLEPERVERVLAQVGLETVARDRVRTYSLGMRQRLGIAAALLGDPDVLILDEPTNGMDPEGIGWLQELLRSYAAAGRTALISSHHMSELEQVADRVVVIAAGRVVADADLTELVHGPGAPRLRVQTPDTAALRSAVAEAGGRCTPAGRPSRGADRWADTGDVDGRGDGVGGAVGLGDRDMDGRGAGVGGALGIVDGDVDGRGGGGHRAVGLGDGDVGVDGYGGGVDGAVGIVDVDGLSALALAELFLRARIRVLGLAPVRVSLQDVYAGLTADLEQYRSSAGALPEPSGAPDHRYAAAMSGPRSSWAAEGVAGR